MTPKCERLGSWKAIRAPWNCLLVGGLRNVGACSAGKHHAEADTARLPVWLADGRKLAGTAGVEPATFWFEARYSIQLSYAPRSENDCAGWPYGKGRFCRTLVV